MGWCHQVGYDSDLLLLLLLLVHTHALAPSGAQCL
jgi:hypothetical protein